MTATPFFLRGPWSTIERDRGLVEGDLVLLRASGRGGGRAKVLQRIGRPEVARDVLEALMLDRGLRRGFEPVVERQAREIRVPPEPRRDLRDLVTFTIDPLSARDFDDALSAERREGGWRVWVHIADVAAHVRPGSAIDREALRRATSVYVPGAVEPMLPAALSSDACSLVPGEDRLAVTVELDLVGTRVRRRAFYRSLVRSDARLDYDQVDRVFAGRERALTPWGQPLALARELAALLERQRSERGALLIESSEPEFDFDDAGQVIAMRRTEGTEAHRLIEHLMILANEQVAALLAEHRAPTLYRVHERPDGAGVERLLEQLASLDVATPPAPQDMTPQQAADVVAEASRLIDEHVRRTGRGRSALTMLVLRTLKQAYYSPRNVGHAGLHSSCYCHFTSPIRRYPDLICHRALLAAVGAGEPAPQAPPLERLGAWTSARERDAMAIERNADDVVRCFLLERELRDQGWEQELDGEVVGLIGAGAFVGFGDGYEGLLPMRALRGDWWELDELGTILRGSRSGRAIRLGDPVRVQVDRIDAPRGRVDLLPVEV